MDRLAAHYHPSRMSSQCEGCGSLLVSSDPFVRASYLDRSEAIWHLTCFLEAHHDLPLVAHSCHGCSRIARFCVHRTIIEAEICERLQAPICERCLSNGAPRNERSGALAKSKRASAGGHPRTAAQRHGSATTR